MVKTLSTRFSDVLKKAPQSKPFDANVYNVQVVDPSSIDGTTVQELADIIDGKTVKLDDENMPKITDAPNTVDLIANALAVVYAEKEGVPVAVAILNDPTTQNYKGVVPSDIYTLQSAVNLENMMDLIHFVITDDNKYNGVEREMLNKLEELSPGLFSVQPINNEEENLALYSMHFKLRNVIQDMDEASILWTNM